MNGQKKTKVKTIDKSMDLIKEQWPITAQIIIILHQHTGNWVEQIEKSHTGKCMLNKFHLIRTSSIVIESTMSGQQCLLNES